MILLEVEQKFNWKMETLNKLLNASFRPIQPLPFKVDRLYSRAFRDTYYDSHDKLSSNGFWVRKRLSLPGGCKWEAKQSQGVNTFVRTTFKETEDLKEIQKIVQEHVPSAPDPSHNFGLNELCQFTTWRIPFVVEGKFDIVLDETDFGHRIGEIELRAEDPEKAHAAIDAFLEKHAELFDTKSTPKGKLTAYFEKFGYPNREC